MATSAIKYAAYIAICCLVVRKIDHCVRKCMEPPDDWDIHAECTGTEKAAGFLRKKGKGANVWTKRYIVIDRKKIIYYEDQMRAVAKGEIVLAGAVAEKCSTRPDEETKFYFNITHPVCGTREFYAKSDARRRQWLVKINTISAELILGACYGTLYKLGGLTGNVWQERWCVCAGETLDYFDAATSNQSKGGLSIKGAAVRHVKRADQSFCFEVEADALTAEPKKNFFGSSKANKVYTFSVPSQYECDRWVTVLQAAALVEESAETIHKDGLEFTVNPMNPGAAGGLGLFVKEVQWPSREGVLAKKSTKTFAMSSWQDRWFALSKEHKAVVYSKEKGSEEKGRILLMAIIEQKGIIQDKDEPNIFRFYVRPNNRKYELRAPSAQEAADWVQALLQWIDLLKNGGTAVADPQQSATQTKSQGETENAAAVDDDD
jgi:hypothetical protein